MKKTIAVILGLAIFAGVSVQAQDAGTNNLSTDAGTNNVSTNSASPSVTSQTETIHADITLPVDVGAAIAAQAIIPQGTVQAVGTNVVIRGVATVVIPSSQFSQYVTGLPDTYDVTNLVRSAFHTTPNGVVVNAVLTKQIQ